MTASLAKLRLAWRDLWTQGRRSIFFALLVAAGVASLVGVQGMARSMAGNIRATARQMVQGDVLITKSKALTPAQQSALHELEHSGAKVTETIQATSHVQNGQGHSMIEIKVVDPQVWPFYGGLKTSPEGVRLGKGEALVGPELLQRLKLSVGDSFQLNKSTTVKIVGTVLQEPMPLGQMQMGPRVIVSTESWDNASPGNLQQVLIKLPAAVTAADAKAQLLQTFDQNDVTTADDAWQALASTMNQIFTFLSMIALISLLVGGLGVAMAMRTFISQKLEHIAVLKALGATSGTVMTVFLAEAAMLGVGGSVVGAAVGMGVQAYLPKLFQGLIPVPSDGLNWMAAAGGLAAGVAIAVLSALVPVRAIRAIKPVALFRGDTGASKMGWKAWAEVLVTGLLTLAGVAWLTVTYAKSTLTGLGFLGGLLAATLILFLLSWVLLRVLRLLPQSGRPAARHAVRSLQAPGNQSASVVVAMGLGILLMTLVYLIQNSLIQQMKTVGVGPDTANLFIMSQQADKRADMVEMLEKHPKVKKLLQTTLAVQAEILTVDGKSVADPKGKSDNGAVTMTDSPAAMPKNVKIRDGEWFTQADKGQPYLTVSDRFAKSYNMHVGSTITLAIRDKNVPFTVTSIYTTVDDGSMSSSLGNLSAAPGAMDAYADNFMVTAVTKPHQEENVIADLLERHPEAMPVSMEAYVEMFESLLTRIANILRFLTAFAVVAAGVILSGSLSATRFRRRKEAALLKTLGATRLTVAAASALENGLLGIVAGFAGAGLAYGMVQVATVVIKMRLELSAVPLVLAALAGCLMAMLVGLGSTVDVLQVKPLSVLRSE